jgi:Cdc6-like AAA superfamily ATPase
MEEPTKKLLVRILDEFSSREFEDTLVRQVNELQKLVELTTEAKAEVDFEVYIAHGGVLDPYVFTRERGTIYTGCYTLYSVTIEEIYYVCYFLSVLLLEDLYVKVTNEYFKVYPGSDNESMNEHVWYGSLPAATERVEDQLRGSSNAMRLLVEDIVRIRRSSFRTLEVLTRRARQVADRISALGLQGGYDPHGDLKDVFMYSYQDEVVKVTQAINSEEGGAVRSLVELITPCQRQSADRLLAVMADVYNNELSQLANKALKIREYSGRSVTADASQQAPTQQSERPQFDQKIGLKAAELKWSAPDISVTAEPPKTPTPIGAKVAAAASEYDKPVDALGYRSYANALGDLITHSETGTPLTIAICGLWGSGKTTLMDYIKDRIKKVNEESDTEFIQLDFDAWTYSKSDAIWAPFYSAVLKGIEGSLGFWEKTWFRFSMRFKTERAKTTGWIAVGVVSLAIFAALLYMTFANAPTTGDPNATELKQVVTVFEGGEGADSTATLVIREPKAKSLSPLSLDYWTLERLVGTVSSLFGFVIALVKILTSVSSGVLGKVKKSGKDLLPLAQEDVVKYVDNVRAWLEPRLDGGKRKRFIVFVDDIDRVEPNKIIQMMEAIQLFLRTKGFVFVLCMDARVVRQAIGQHYSFMGTTHGDREWWGHHYLEKIIQIPFYLPRIDLKGMNSLKEKLLGSFVAPSEPRPKTLPDEDRAKSEPVAGTTEEDIPDVKPEVADQPPEQPTESVTTVDSSATPIVDDSMEMRLTRQEDSALNELFRDGLELSPRLLIRLKNVYLLARHVYLKSGTARQVPPVFTKWIALSVKYPFEIKELVETCALIGWPESWQEVIRAMTGPDAEKWKDLNKDHLEMLAKLLPKHVPSPKDVQQFVAVTNCFNLVLE